MGLYLLKGQRGYRWLCFVFISGTNVYVLPMPTCISASPCWQEHMFQSCYTLLPNIYRMLSEKTWESFGTQHSNPRLLVLNWMLSMQLYLWHELCSSFEVKGTVTKGIIWGTGQRLVFHSLAHIADTSLRNQCRTPKPQRMAQHAESEAVKGN